MRCFFFFSKREVATDVKVSARLGCSWARTTPSPTTERRFFATTLFWEPRLKWNSYLDLQSLVFDFELSVFPFSIREQADGWDSDDAFEEILPSQRVGRVHTSIADLNKNQRSVRWHQQGNIFERFTDYPSCTEGERKHALLPFKDRQNPQTTTSSKHSTDICNVCTHVTRCGLLQGSSHEHKKSIWDLLKEYDQVPAMKFR